MKKTNFINIIIYLFIVLALFIISCEEELSGSGGDTGGISACTATDESTLVTCIESAMKEQGIATTPDLSKITLGEGVTDLSGLFSNRSPLLLKADMTGYVFGTFNADISSWDVSNIENFENMFLGASAFNQNLSKWDLTGKQQTDMFTNSGMDFALGTDVFGQYEKYPIGYHATTPADKTALVAAIAKIMIGQKNAATPTLRIINTSSVEDFSALFSNTSPLPTTTEFDAATFNADIRTWDVSKGIDFTNMFNGASEFNQDLSAWDITGQIQIDMFKNSGMVPTTELEIFPKGYKLETVNKPANRLTFIRVIEDIISKSTDKNEPILSSLDTSLVTDFSGLFSSDGPLGTGTSGFVAATFNADISGWKISSGTNFNNMFNGAAAFKRDLSGWNITNEATTVDMFKDSAMDFDLPAFTEFGTYPIGYQVAPADTTALVAAIEKIMIVQKNAATPTLSIINTSKITDMSNLFSGNSDDGRGSTGLLVANAENNTKFNAETFNADISNWNTSKVTNMSFMFYMYDGGPTRAFNQDINTKEVTVGGKTYIAWDTSNVTNMSNMFAGAKVFNQPIGNWNTSKVTTMNGMFLGAADFNQNINTKEVTFGGTTYNAWDVGAVRDLFIMFNGAKAFNQDLRGWTWDPAPTYGITVNSMFNGATSMLPVNFPKICKEATGTVPYPAAGNYTSNNCTGF